MLWSDISFFGVPVMICVAVFTRLYYFPIIFSEAELAQIDDDGTAIDDGPPPAPLHSPSSTPGTGSVVALAQHGAV